MRRGKGGEGVIISSTIGDYAEFSEDKSNKVFSIILIRGTKTYKL